MSKDARVDAYIEKAAPFARPILKKLRKVVHTGCPGVKETIKWGMPAFEHKGPLCGMASFKGHATFGFWKAALLESGGRPLGKAKEAMGQFGRLESLGDLPSERVLVALVRQAAALNEAGVKVPRTRKPERNAASPDRDRGRVDRERAFSKLGVREVGIPSPPFRRATRKGGKK
jgi:hypothetical protein